MSYIKSTKFNVELIRDLPASMKDELILLDDVIPDDIMASLYVNDLSYKERRHDFIDHHPALLEKMHIARDHKRSLDTIADRLMFEADREIQFIKDYPQFKPLIESVIYLNGSGDIVETVPIDQYLAEN